MSSPRPIGERPSAVIQTLRALERESGIPWTWLLGTTLAEELRQAQEDQEFRGEWIWQARSRYMNRRPDVAEIVDLLSAEAKTQQTNRAFTRKGNPQH